MKILRVILQLKKSSIDSETEAFKEYLYDINNLASKEKEKLDRMVNEMVAQNPDDAQDIYEHFSDQYAMYETKYVELINNGSLVNSYSFFEHQLKDIVRTLKKFVTNPKGTFKHRKNLSYTENLRNEILAITGLDFSSLATDWTTLDKYRILRNIIVHNGANLLEKEGTALTEQTNYSLVNTFSKIKINRDNGDFFITDKELVADYFDLVDRYLKNVLDILKLLDNNDIR